MKVSIIAPSYNHEAYIEEAIESVISQSYQDYELIIVDDGSSDQTYQVACKYRGHPKIRLMRHSHNQGVTAASLTAYKEARGEYITYLATDDVYLPNKLEKEIECLSQNPKLGAVFSRVEFINEESKEIQAPKSKVKLNQVENRSRFEWLNYLFYSENCFSVTSQMIRKKCFEQMSYFDPRYRQLTHYECNIRLFMNYEAEVINESLIKWRIRSHDPTLNTPSLQNHNRFQWELSQAMRNFLMIEKLSDLLEVFPELRAYYDHLDEELIPFYIAMLAYRSNRKEKVAFALQVLFDLLADPGISKKLQKQHGFSYIDFMEISGKYEVFSRKDEGSRVSKLLASLRYGNRGKLKLTLEKKR